MGQYHVVVNLSKCEYIHPHRLGVGTKAWEQIASSVSTPHALFALLMCANGRGGGDLPRHPVIGRWAGDRIAVVGDYTGDGDLDESFHAGSIYERCDRDGSIRPMDELVRGVYGPDPATAQFADITTMVQEMLSTIFEVDYQDRDSGFTKMTVRPDSWLNEE